MTDTLGGLLTIVLLVALLAAVYVPYGDYMARVYSSTTHLRVERLVYRLGGVDPDAEQGARSYATSVVGFSLVSIVVLMGMQLGQAALPMDRDLPGVGFWMSFNTAVSFVTNTNWQSYSGESTLGFTVQMAGLAVQNFLSAAVGIAIAVALIRGFVRSRSSSLGNFWVDLTRGTIRILLPISFVAAVLLIAGGVVQSFSDTTMQTLAGHSQVLTGGPVASQEAIKELGNNGGGFFNANSAHPFENPTALTNIFEIFLILVLPVALTRTLGTMLGNRRQGLAVLGVMGVLWSASLAVATWAEVGGHSPAAQAAGAAMEGKETRFGEWASALFAVATTGTSTGAVNASHDSLTATGGGVIEQASTSQLVLVPLAGVVTTVPLLLFAAAAQRVPLTTLGPLQYAVPIINFALGTVIYDEAMPAWRLVGFALVWVALAIFTVDALRATPVRGAPSEPLEPELEVVPLEG